MTPLVAQLETWMCRERARLSRHAPVAKAMDYMLKRWTPSPASSPTAVSASPTTPPSGLRGIALGRKAWLFAGSDRGGESAAFMYRLITTAKLNGLDPQAWLADVLACIAGTANLSRLRRAPPVGLEPGTRLGSSLTVVLAAEGYSPAPSELPLRSGRRLPSCDLQTRQRLKLPEPVADSIARQRRAHVGGSRRAAQPQSTAAGARASPVAVTTASSSPV